MKYNNVREAEPLTPSLANGQWSVGSGNSCIVTPITGNILNNIHIHSLFYLLLQLRHPLNWRKSTRKQKVDKTAMNEFSSRSYLLVFIKITVIPVTGDKYGESLSLIDLAGNENPQEAIGYIARQEALKSTFLSLL